MKTKDYKVKSFGEACKEMVESHYDVNYPEEWYDDFVSICAAMAYMERTGAPYRDDADGLHII